MERPEGVSDKDWNEAMAIYNARAKASTPAAVKPERKPITLWTLFVWWFVGGLVINAIFVLGKVIYETFGK